MQVCSLGKKKDEKETLSHHPRSQSNVGHLNHLIRGQKIYDFDIDLRHRRSQPQAVRPHPRRLSLALYFSFLVSFRLRVRPHHVDTNSSPLYTTC